MNKRLLVGAAAAVVLVAAIVYIGWMAFGGGPENATPNRGPSRPERVYCPTCNLDETVKMSSLVEQAVTTPGFWGPVDQAHASFQTIPCPKGAGGAGHRAWVIEAGQPMPNGKP